MLDWKFVTAGVPQAAIFLFTLMIYFNDVLINYVELFANDTLIQLESMVIFLNDIKNVFIKLF